MRMEREKMMLKSSRSAWKSFQPLTTSWSRRYLTRWKGERSSLCGAAVLYGNVSILLFFFFSFKCNFLATLLWSFHQVFPSRRFSRERDPTSVWKLHGSGTDGEPAGRVAHSDRCSGWCSVTGVCRLACTERMWIGGKPETGSCSCCCPVHH